MKWIKHMTATWDDENVARLVQEGGKDGLALYGAWWRVLEIVASRVESKDQNASVTYSVSRWSLLMSVRGSHVSHYLGHLAKNDLVTVEWIGTDIRVTIPNLLKYRDEYSRKSGHAPDNIPPRTELDTDTELEEEHISKKLSPSRAQIETVYKLYPKHVGKAAAEKAIAKAIKLKGFDPLLLAVQAYLRKIARDGTDPRFIPHPATWFNQARYDDEEFKPDYAVRPSTNGSSKPQKVIAVGSYERSLIDDADVDSMREVYSANLPKM